MREILFRGKGTGGYHINRWVYGYYCKDFWAPRKGDGILPTDKECGGYVEVDPETVGQYTGLTDKNGTKIFEGDVVKAVIVRDLDYGTQNREETGIIGYDKIGMIGLIAKYVGTIPVWSDFFQELVLSGCINDFWFEVIGNIHDNPELLEAPNV